MGESASARTERELAELRSRIDGDLRLLEQRVREDLDPRRLVRRNPIAVFGAVGSAAAIAVVGTLRALAERSRRRTDTDLDAMIARLGGRADRLKGRARGRLRESLRREIGKIEQGPRIRSAALGAVSTAITAALTLVARRFASRLVTDEELPSGGTTH